MLGSSVTDGDGNPIGVISSFKIQCTVSEPLILTINESNIDMHMVLMLVIPSPLGRPSLPYSCISLWCGSEFTQMYIN